MTGGIVRFSGSPGLGAASQSDLRCSAWLGCNFADFFYFLLVSSLQAPVLFPWLGFCAFCLAVWLWATAQRRGRPRKERLQKKSLARSLFTQSQSGLALEIRFRCLRSLGSLRFALPSFCCRFTLVVYGFPTSLCSDSLAGFPAAWGEGGWDSPPVLHPRWDGGPLSFFFALSPSFFLPPLICPRLHFCLLLYFPKARCNLAVVLTPRSMTLLLFVCFHRIVFWSLLIPRQWLSLHCFLVIADFRVFLLYGLLFGR